MVKEGELGLLLYQGGTVCDDFFNNNAADAICKLMNYTYSLTWNSDESFNIQVFIKNFLDIYSTAKNNEQNGHQKKGLLTSVKI